MIQKAILSSVLCMGIGLHAFPQDFIILYSSADSLRMAGDLNGALKEFSRIQAKDPKDGANASNAAFAFSITGNMDSAFKYVRRELQIDSNRYVIGEILFAPDLNNMKEDPRWRGLEDTLAGMASRAWNEHFADVEYAKVLWRMQALDQAYYEEIEEAQRKTGPSSTIVIALWKLKGMIDRRNQQQLEALVERKGWPTISDVGERGAEAAFLVIQHSDLEKHKKYLPVIEALCRKKEASWQSYALMYDRIQVNEGKPQRYGSQIRSNDATGANEPFPLENAARVDEWRKAIGMMPLAEYLARYNSRFQQKQE